MNITPDQRKLLMRKATGNTWLTESEFPQATRERIVKHIDELSSLDASYLIKDLILASAPVATPYEEADKQFALKEIKSIIEKYADRQTSSN